MRESRDEAAAEAAALAQGHGAAMQALKAEQAYERQTATAAAEEAQRSAAAKQQEVQQALDAWKARFASR